jgi:MFS family permease
MITDYLRALGLFSRNVRLYLIATSVFGLTIFGGIYSVLLNLYLLRLGYGPEFVGLVNAVGYLCFAVFSLPAGALGGRWGSRRTMIAGLSLALVGFGALPLAEFMPRALQDGWLLATYLLGWLGAALFTVNSSPFLMGSTGPKERNHVFSAQAALWSLAGFAGSLVGGLLPGLFAATLGLSLDHPASYRYPLLIAALLIFPGVLAIWATREVRARRMQETAPETSPAPLGLIGLMSLAGLLTVAGEGSARTFFNVYLDAGLHVSAVQIGTLSAAGQLLAIPAALAMPLLAARWGTSRTVALGSFGVALSLLPLALLPHWGAAGLGYMSMIALAAIRRPAFTLYGQEVVPLAWRAATSGATSMAAGLGFSVMSFGGGYIITALGYPSLFLAGTALTAAGGLIFWSYFCVRRPKLLLDAATDGAE